MYAIVQQGTKQLEVVKGKTYQFDRVLGKPGDEISFKEVLLVVDKKKRHIGTPYVKGAEVTGKIINEVKGKKVLVRVDFLPVVCPRLYFLLHSDCP